MAVPSVIQLQCGCNSYPWGKQGSKSLAATLCAKTPGWEGDGPSKKFSIDESKPYAEMWMGTYPELPSYVLSTGEDLQKLIDKNPQHYIGDGVLKKYGHSKIPFLPKILSIAKALPLQLHPNKDLAAKLHKEDPSNFTDPNHKPEIALALSDFEAFCGFKPLKDIQGLLKLDPLAQFLLKKSSDFTNDDLKEVVRAMLKADESTVKHAVDGLQKLPESSFGSYTYIPSLIPRLVEQYEKTDNGILVALITMNFLKLKAGECISIPADGIHAYLSGDIVECMARSNNVLNTGFCPRAERNSIDLFCSCLTFSPHSAEECRLAARPYHGSSNGNTKVFNPPMNEFNILQIDLKSNDKEVLGPIDGPSIAIATSGSGKLGANGEEFDIKEGSIWFIGKGTEIKLESDSGLTLFTAYADPST